jgi:hypothetical protein
MTPAQHLIRSIKIIPKRKADPTEIAITYQTAIKSDTY